MHSKHDQHGRMPAGLVVVYQALTLHPRGIRFQMCNVMRKSLEKRTKLVCFGAAFENAGYPFSIYTLVPLREKPSLEQPPCL
jgi:hypothetical protein